jgi:adenosylcobyric acid synthase
VAGLSRALAQRGLGVRPFKPQNMSNNAAVTPGGGEIGRAQALQARACRIPPSVHMNPVLLKPQSDIGAQVVVQGRVRRTARAAQYLELKRELMTAVRESFDIVRRGADIVLVEGAGSPAEINLRVNDIANMGFARAFGVPVVLVGDIDRGGVIASLVGTHAVLDDADREMIRGFVINKFRGDAGLFVDGLRAIETRTGWKGFGVLPFVQGLALPAEDAIELKGTEKSDRRVRIAVPLFRRIANADEFDPLQLESGVELLFIPPGRPLPRDCDLVILPGSKATIADLRFLKEQGWNIDIAAHVRQGGRVLGLCGGYQMLGRVVRDPSGIETAPGSEEQGLGYLDIDTTLTQDKVLREVGGTCLLTGAAFSGYEMHMGRGQAGRRPMLCFEDGAADGAVSPDGLVAGCYVHGIFTGDAFRTAWLERIGGTPSQMSYEARVEESLDVLAAAIEMHLDVDGLLAIAGDCG